MAWPTKKPASGMPASGPGWGGEAKGSGRGGAHTPQKRMTKRGKANEADPTGAITTETATEMAERGADPEVRAVNAAKLADRVATAEELKRKLTLIALFGEHETNQMNASKALLDRIEGVPGPANNTNDDTTIQVIGGLPDDDPNPSTNPSPQAD
jgi:hypothetical protein